MKQNSDKMRSTIIGVAVVVALLLAIWSAVNTFGSKGKTIGTLGNLNETSGTSGKQGASGSAGQSPATQEKTGGPGLSGAPAGMGDKGP